jgi:hypothetical protein
MIARGLAQAEQYCIENELTPRFALPWPDFVTCILSASYLCHLLCGEQTRQNPLREIRATVLACQTPVCSLALDVMSSVAA